MGRSKRRRAAQFAAMSVVAGAALTVGIGWFGAWDLATRSIEYSQGSIIGAGGYFVETPLLLRALRLLTPARWHAWPRAEELFIPERASGTASAHDIRDFIFANPLQINAACTRGLFDSMAVTRPVVGGADESGAQQWTDSVAAPAALGGSSRQAAILHRLGVPSDSVPIGQFDNRRLNMLELLVDRGAVDSPWSTVVGEVGANLDPEGASSEGQPALTWLTVETTEIRLYGWPLRCLAVYGAAEERSAFTPDGDELAWRYRRKSDGIFQAPPIADWPPVSALPATGLPWKPLWLPFLANSLVLGVPLTLAGVGVSRAARAGLAKFRGRGDRCPRCGYPRKGLDRGAACPECGGG